MRLTKISIKKIVFIPSQKEVWEIKSSTNNRIYFADLNNKFCSCKGFYYNFKKRYCYHLDEISSANNEKSYHIIFYDDNQINNYLSRLISDTLNIN